MSFKSWKAVDRYLGQGWIILYEGRLFRRRKFGDYGKEILYMTMDGNWESTGKEFDQWREGKIVEWVKKYGFQE